MCFDDMLNCIRTILYEYDVVVVHMWALSSRIRTLLYCAL